MVDHEDDEYEEGHEGIYEESFREKLEEGDEISEVEEGFMHGYDEEEAVTKCAICKKVLTNHNYIEEEVYDKTYRFCSERCADKFTKKLNR